ncbi:MAG: hypothetical protein ACI4XW_09160 [Candidatus Spyradocola sp.]
MMKKLMALLLCLLLALTVAGCAKEAPGENVQIPSPVVDCATLEEAAELAGFTLEAPGLPAGYDDAAISVISDSMIQLIYRSGEGREMVLRKAQGEGDVSGNYTVYEQERALDVDGVAVTLRGDADAANLALWTRDGFAYSASVSEGLDDAAMSALIRAIR